MKIETITIDPRYQRELDENRAQAMSKNIDFDRIGVPVLSFRGRTAGTSQFVVLDGQHRVSALKQAGHGPKGILCEVHEGLNVVEEASLFLKLNGGRKAVCVYDKWRAQLVAKVPMAIEIDKVVGAAGLKVTKGPGRNCICAIQAIWSVHLKYRNLDVTLAVLKAWADGEPAVYSAEAIKAVSEFLRSYPQANPNQLVTKLSDIAPERLCARIQRQASRVDRISFRRAAVDVLREIYNHRSRTKLPPLHATEEAA